MTRGFDPVEARALLRARNVSEDEVALAEAEGRLHLLVLDHLLLRHEPRYTVNDIAELSGLPTDLAVRLWRALGFPDAHEEERIFTDADLDALSTVQGLIAMGFAETEVAVQLARVIGQSMARISEAEIQAAPGLRDAESSARAAELFALTAGGTIDGVARLIEYSWRRHLQAAARRVSTNLRSGGSELDASLVVGFADLVGFTVMSQQLSQAALAEVVGHFEALAFETIGAEGGRVVKMIGDEVMFVVPTPEQGARIGLALAEAYGDDERLSDVRVGLASGSVLAREGDFYGPVVNLASRIVNIARPGSVLVSEAMHDALAADPSFEWRSLRSRYLKDIGRVQVWSLVGRRDEADGDGTAEAPAPERPRRRAAQTGRRRVPNVFDLVPEPFKDRLSLDRDGDD